MVGLLRLSVLALTLAWAWGCVTDTSPASPPSLRPTLAPVAGAPRPLPVADFATATPYPTFTPPPAPTAVRVSGVDLWGQTQIGDDGAPLPTATAAAPAAGLLPVPTATPSRRYTCRIDYRRWLVATRSGGSTQRMKNGLTTFRELRPDCVRGKFDPIFSVNALCSDENRVAGITVMSRFSLGRDYNHNLRLGPTARSGWGDMLIHFERLPEQSAAGCWYYEAARDRWFEEVVGETAAASGATPAPAGVSPTFRSCEDELRSRIEGLVGVADHRVLNDLVLEVSTGLSACSVNWYPVAAADNVSSDCPALASGKSPDGSVFSI